MSFSIVTINADGIGKYVKQLEKDDKNNTTIKLYGTKYCLINYYEDDNTISFEQHVTETTEEEITYALASHNPGIELEVNCNCHDLYGYTYKCGFVDNKFEKWDLNSIHWDDPEYDDYDDYMIPIR